MKRILLYTALLLAQSAVQKAGDQDHTTGRTDQPWQVEVAAGLNSFYLPGVRAGFDRPELVTMAGFGKLLGKKQAFSVTLQVGFARNNYNGDAVFLQLLGQYTPAIGGRLESGIGLGLATGLPFPQPPPING